MPTYMLDMVGVIIFLTLDIWGVALCPPAEEGQPYTFTGHWNIENEQEINFGVSWRKNNVPVATCAYYTKCRNYFSYPIRTTLTRNRKQEFSSSLTLESVSRTNEGIWTLVHVGMTSHKDLEITTFYLKVYARSKNTKCSYSLDTVNAYVTCRIVGIYPSALCTYMYYTQQSIMLPGNVTYQIHNTTEEINCKITLPLTNLEKDSPVDVIITIYPNVTNHYTDMDYGDNITIKIEKEQQQKTTTVKPKLYLQECLLEIEVGESVRCTCRVSSLSEATVLWYHDSQIVFSNTTNVLEFKAEKNATFICRMYTSDNLTAGEIVYSPNIVGNYKYINIKWL
ncbi:uncharacterized protein LOC106065946 [Biomphalaria glabrata]|uniref:Uncharacterized protein LOC106065946 n=1 Tax=Biomphalaria glabrata TaxID=6526 RepID=A0A9W2YVS4_BIOGL|nr:uncharacterized protein LOC106065946 [Biomphalaria glabrata]